MVQDVVVNGTTYPAVEAVAMQDANGNTVTYYPDAVRYVPQTLTPEQQAQARENIGVNEAFKAEITAMVIESLGGNPIFGTVDKNNNIVVSGNLPDGTYSVKYEMEDGTTVNIGNLVLDTNVYYTVTNTLTNCTNSNSTTKVAQGSAYSATITAKSGYELKSVSATMGGTAVSVSNGEINIASVAGNIVITAVAEEIKANYTNLAKTFKEGYRISSSSGLSAQAGATAVEDYIPAKAGDVVRIKGFGALDDWQTCTYTESKTAISASKPATAFADGTYSYDESTEIATLTISSSNVRFVRVSGVLTGTTADVIITVNEPIE